jgi:hypothetical protein
MDRSARINAYVSHRALGSQAFIGLSFALFVFASVMSMMAAVEPRRGFEDTSLSACADFRILPALADSKTGGDHQASLDAVASENFEDPSSRFAVAGPAFGYERSLPVSVPFEARGPPCAAPCVAA